MGKEGNQPNQVRSKNQVSSKSRRGCSFNSFNGVGREREETWAI